MNRDEARGLIKWLAGAQADGSYPAVHPDYARKLYVDAELPMPDYLKKEIPDRLPSALDKYVTHDTMQDVRAYYEGQRLEFMKKLEQSMLDSIADDPVIPVDPKDYVGIKGAGLVQPIGGRRIVDTPVFLVGDSITWRFNDED